MFVRIAKQKRGAKTYRHLQIAESYRDPNKGMAPRTRILAHLGTVEGLGEEQIQKLIAGFQRAIGQQPAEPDLLFARDCGHVHAVGGVWDQLELSTALNRCGLAGRSKADIAGLIRLLVINRLCDPCSKLALVEWLDTVWQETPMTPSYHQLLRAMDRLLRIKEPVEPLLAQKFLGQQPVADLVFYDITSTYFEGERSLVEDDIRRYGYSRDQRRDRRQVVIGMVITREGIPLCHHVFPGNTADKTTVTEVVSDLKQRFGLRRIIFVGDRGMLSDANLEHLLGEEVGFIVAHPLRRNAQAREVVGALRNTFDETDDEEQVREDLREGVRFVLAYNPKIAQEVRAHRQQRLAKADQWIQSQRRKLEAPSGRGKAPTPQGTYNRIRDYLRDRHLLTFYDVELEDNTLSVRKNRQAVAWQKQIDGLLLLETTDFEVPAAEVVKHYKELAEIERGWRTLKSSLLLRPVYHWTERRIRAHIFICMLALQLERWMRNRLQALSVSKALGKLQQIKVGELIVNGQPVTMTTRLNDEQKEIYRRLGIKPLPAQLPSRQNVV